MELTAKQRLDMFQQGHELGLALEKAGKVQTLGKMGAKYLPWATLWRAVNKLDPIGDVHYRVLTKGDMCDQDLGSEALEVTLPAGTGFEIAVELTWLGKKHITRLAITDHNNKAIENPTSVNVQNTRQRCIAKVISEATGIGLHLWDGEDLEQYKGHSSTKTKDYVKREYPKPKSESKADELEEMFPVGDEPQEQPKVRMASIKQVNLIVSREWLSQEDAAAMTSQEASDFISEKFGK